MSTTQQMTFEEFKATLTERYGKVRFTEAGANGWTSVEDLLNKRPGSASGPHWCDAAPIPGTGHLLGTYDFVANQGTFF